MLIKNNIQTAIDRIQEVRNQKLLFLDLQGLLLYSIPCDISDLDFILDVDISYNNFTSIPKDILDLENLVYLNASNNNISSIDFVFGRHYLLQELDISNNSLSSVPNSLLNLSKDVIISYDNNPFLSSLPLEIEYYGFEKVIYYLELISNQNEFHRNFETKLIFVGSGEVGKTTLMKVLKDQTYPVELGKELTTHGINISSLEYEIFFPAHPPYYNSYKDINDAYYLREQEDDDEDNEEIYNSELTANDNFSYESIPELPSEKYSPITDLLSQYDYEEVLADIMVNPYLTTIFPESVIEKTVTVNLWDFGGQEIYYATHQFFLTKKSVYVFVWEPRKDNYEEDLEYWLKTIHLLGSESPVIVVMNKSDIRIKNIDRNLYKSKYPNIAAFVSVSSLAKTGLSELKHEIKKCIRNLKHIGDKIPKSWVKAREKISEIKTDYINYNQFIELCKSQKLMSNSKEINLFLEYLHDIGVVINFREDSILRNLVIINPQWATKAVYALIDTIEIQRNNGIFNVFELENFWDKEKYPVEKHMELLQLMEKFEICFKVLGAKDTYVIPELLKIEIENPQLLQEIDNDDTLKFQILYGFMPHGIITRLICRQYNLIHKDTYWKNGAVFQHEMTKASAISDRSKKTITLKISGKQKGNLLAIIRSDLEKIHKDFNMQEAIDYKEMIPCRCISCVNSESPYYFDYATLKKFMYKDKLTIECHNSAETVEIHKLITGYSFAKPVKKLIYEILSAASQLQGYSKNLSNNENARNSFIAQRLSQVGIFAKDQSNWGSSETRKNIGSLDIKIEDGNGNILTIFEGVNLKSLDKQNLDSHIGKTISNYDPNGLYEKYLCVYYEGDDFTKFTYKYLTYMNDNVSNSFIDTVDESIKYLSQTEIIIYKSSYLRTGKTIFLYHILINLK